MKEKYSRFKGPCNIPLCQNPSFRRRICKFHYRQRALLTLHCSHKHCVRPIFYGTLCRTHFKKSKQNCMEENCNKFVYCKNKCITHYRKTKSEKFIQPRCIKCKKNIFIDMYCFKHWKTNGDDECSVQNCNNKMVVRHMCRKHYQQWRRKNLNHISSSSNMSSANV